jgi:hypothetical protein
MPRAVEDIPDDATVCRLVVAPKMGASKHELLLPNFFVFERNKEPPPRFLGESLVWTAYAQPVPVRVHELGTELENIQRARGKTDSTYLGYVDALARVIRACKNSKGRGFTLQDAPEEGDHHVEVRLDVAAGVEFPKIEKSDAQLLLAKLFSQLNEFQREA